MQSCSSKGSQYQECSLSSVTLLGSGLFLAALRASIPLSKGVHLKENYVSLELMLLFLCFAFVKSGKPMDPHLKQNDYHSKIGRMEVF